MSSNSISTKKEEMKVNTPVKEQSQIIKNAKRKYEKVTNIIGEVKDHINNEIEDLYQNQERNFKIIQNDSRHLTKIAENNKILLENIIMILNSDVKREKCEEIEPSITKKNLQNINPNNLLTNKRMKGEINSYEVEASTKQPEIKTKKIKNEKLKKLFSSLFEEMDD